MRRKRAGSVLGAAIGLSTLLACAKAPRSDGDRPTPAVTSPPLASTATPTPGPFQRGVQEAEALFDGTKTNHVAVVVVSSTGHVFPSRLIVRKKRYRIVWIPDGEKLDIRFENGALPVDCATFAPVCVAKISPQTETGMRGLKYTGTITKDGVSNEIDPHLEVVR